MYWTDEIMGIGQNRMGGNRRCPDPQFKLIYFYGGNVVLMLFLIQKPSLFTLALTRDTFFLKVDLGEFSSLYS